MMVIWLLSQNLIAFTNYTKRALNLKKGIHSHTMKLKNLKTRSIFNMPFKMQQFLSQNEETAVSVQDVVSQSLIEEIKLSSIQT